MLNTLHTFSPNQQITWFRFYRIVFFFFILSNLYYSSIGILGREGVMIMARWKFTQEGTQKIDIEMNDYCFWRFGFVEKGWLLGWLFERVLFGLIFLCCFFFVSFFNPIVPIIHLLRPRVHNTNPSPFPPISTLSSPSLPLPFPFSNQSNQQSHP